MKMKECLSWLILCGAALPLVASAYPIPDTTAALPPVAPLPACRTSDLIGSQVVGPHGQPVGKLTDVVFDLRHDQISFAVITTSEDDRRIAVPLGVIVTQSGVNTLTLTCDEQRFRAASDFAKADLEDPRWVNSTYAYFDVTPPSYEIAAAQPTTIYEPAGAPLPTETAREHDAAMSQIVNQYQLGKGEAHQMDDKYWNNVSPVTGYPVGSSTLVTAPSTVVVAQPPMPPTCLIRSSDLIGSAVQDANGRPVGAVKDAVVDWSKGRIIFAVLDPSGELSMNGRYIPIAPSALCPTPNGGALTVNVTKETLAAAPNFDRAQWPDVSDANFVGDVYHFYNQMPD